MSGCTRTQKPSSLYQCPARRARRAHAAASQLALSLCYFQILQFVLLLPLQLHDCCLGYPSTELYRHDCAHTPPVSLAPAQAATPSPLPTRPSLSTHAPLTVGLFVCPFPIRILHLQRPPRSFFGTPSACRSSRIESRNRRLASPVHPPRPSAIASPWYGPICPSRRFSLPHRPISSSRSHSANCRLCPGNRNSKHPAPASLSAH